MRKSTILSGVMVGVLLLGATGVRSRAAQQREIEAVRAAVDNYLQGHATGKGEHFQKVFHADSKLFWVRDGQLLQRTSADYIAGASGQPAADEAHRKRWIETVDHEKRRSGEGGPRLSRHTPHGLHVHAENQRRVENRQQDFHVGTQNAVILM